MINLNDELNDLKYNVNVALDELNELIKVLKNDINVNSEILDLENIASLRTDLISLEKYISDNLKGSVDSGSAI